MISISYIVQHQIIVRLVINELKTMWKKAVPLRQHKKHNDFSHSMWQHGKHLILSLVSVAVLKKYERNVTRVCQRLKRQAENL